MVWMGDLSQIELFAWQKKDRWVSGVMRQIAVLPYSGSTLQYREKDKCQISKVFAIEKVSKSMYNIHGKRTRCYGGVDHVKAKD